MSKSIIYSHQSEHQGRRAPPKAGKLHDLRQQRERRQGDGRKAIDDDRSGRRGTAAVFGAQRQKRQRRAQATRATATEPTPTAKATVN